MTAAPASAAAGVVVVAYGPEPELAECLTAVQASRQIDVELVVVDNCCTHPQLEQLVAATGGRLLRPGRNVGFAAGCNLAVQALPPGVPVALVNSDAVVEPGTLRALLDALHDDVGIATASVRLADEPELLNSAGNPVHFTGLSWAGGLGERAEGHVGRRDVASASGATLMVRRDVWDELGGFDPTYFTYLEDTELSLRCWLSGRRVRYVPTAVSLHHYAFSRNPRKLHYLERNRLLMLLTVYERRTLLLLAPALLLWEVVVLAGSVLQGWWRSKLLGWWWLLRNARQVSARRRLVQGSRRHGDEVLVPLLAERISPGGGMLPRGFGLVDAVLAGYWRRARRRLSARVSPDA